ncbi:MAG: DUF4194 domain-containing protein [Candidatus Izemoplasmatales bacterium]|uniref:DUF4194 domain-containing protein n=1 Tax=Hujiaoplasma nucleasis TaxID=2725268 RepID=A0A7L6N296_9MOLU|nr:DUF4194 domain-containing protein [Hujiaoplasma nucleasis]QLY39562.1 DUF4194 domain-containing protein [Hujiaoplasma nucleasis]
MILENFEELNVGQQKLFAKTCLRLLQNSFLAKDKEDNKEMYYFIISFKQYFDEYFDVMEFDLILDREMGAVQLVHRENNNLLRLKKDESIVLLILRILFHEHLVKTSINDNVVIKVDEIHDYYDSLELKKKINKTDLVKILRLFKKYNLIETLGDITKSSTPIIIYPTILLAINTQTINDVYNIISHIENKNGSEKNEKTFEN